MLDRTDLQLMLLEQLSDMDTDNLIEVFQQMTGHDLEHNANDQINGSLETIEIADPVNLRKMLGFLLYALGERVEIPIED